MDGLAEDLGRLSTSAREWIPGGSGSNTTAAPQAASIRAEHAAVDGMGGATVREFVPGVGLTSSASSADGGGGSGAAAAAAMSGGADSDAGGGGALPWHDRPHHHGRDDREGPATLASPPPPASPYTSRRTLASLGLPEDLRSHYRSLDVESARELPPDDPRLRAVPPSYASAYPLDASPDGARPDVAAAADGAIGGPGGGRRSSFGYPSLAFRVRSRDDGRLYCLRRYDSCARSVSHKIAGAVRDAWVHAVDPSSSSAPPHHHHAGGGGGDGAAGEAGGGAGARARRLVDHPGLVRLYRAFVSQRAAFFVHRYHPGARTIRERFLAGRSGPNGMAEPPLPEALIWNVAVQLVSAVRAVHGANLACRTLQSNHVLVVPEEGGIGFGGADPSDGAPAASALFPDAVRVRVNCIGVVDALEFESRKSPRDLQREDVRSLGRLVLSLAAGAELGTGGAAGGGGAGGGGLSAAAMAVDWSDESALGRVDALLARRRYSSRLRRFGLALAASPDVPGINAVSESVAHRSLDALDRAHAALDRASLALRGEYDSSRSLRLLLKLGYVNDRPEFGYDLRWSETGDRYVLQLFRDYLFHQCDAAGRPAMDVGHVLGTLNRLEAAREDEKVVLSSRDGQSLLVVSYADVARCLEGAFGELCEGSAPMGSGNGGGGSGGGGGGAAAEHGSVGGGGRRPHRVVGEVQGAAAPAMGY